MTYEHETQINIGGTLLDAVVRFEIESYGEGNFDYPGHICDGGGSGPEIVITSVRAGPLQREYLTVLAETLVLPFRINCIIGFRSAPLWGTPRVVPTEISHYGQTALEALEEEILADDSYFAPDGPDDYDPRDWE